MDQMRTSGGEEVRGLRGLMAEFVGVMRWLSGHRGRVR